MRRYTPTQKLLPLSVPNRPEKLRKFIWCITVSFHYIKAHSRDDGDRNVYHILAPKKSSSLVLIYWTLFGDARLWKVTVSGQ